jgi:hypothetical protein
MLSNEFDPRRASAGIRFAGIRRDRQIPAPITFPDAAPASLTASSSTETHAHADERKSLSPRHPPFGSHRVSEKGNRLPENSRNPCQ